MRQAAYSGGEECIGADHESACSLNEGCKGRVKVAFGARSQDVKLNPESAGRGLQACRDRVRESRIGRVNEQGHGGRRGNQFVQQLQAFRSQLHPQYGHAREIAAGPCEVGDKPNRDRVSGSKKDDWNRRGCALAASVAGVSGVAITVT